MLDSKDGGYEERLFDIVPEQKNFYGRKKK